uniref:hypothetical protein n=1 Tax=Kroppenstedtia sanguinis TaxID=1380684 RepID=UPI003D1CE45C
MLTLSGVGISLYGNTLDSPLLTWFPLIGILLGISQLYYWLRPPAERIHWKIQHLTGLISCGIGTITAFVVFGAPRPSNRGSPTDHLVSAHHSAHPGNHRL